MKKRYLQFVISREGPREDSDNHVWSTLATTSAKDFDVRLSVEGDTETTKLLETLCANGWPLTGRCPLLVEFEDEERKVVRIVIPAPTPIQAHSWVWLEEAETPVLETLMALSTSSASRR